MFYFALNFQKMCLNLYATSSWPNQVVKNECHRKHALGEIP